MKLKSLIVLFVTPLFFQCASTLKKNVNSIRLSNMKSFTYVDGNNNTYEITESSLSYDPVKPENSSSGTYSGGTPYSMDLNVGQWESIRSAVERTLKDNDNLVDTRTMGSGMLIIEGSKYYLGMNSEGKDDIENTISSVTGR